ncbi:glutamate racemase [Aquifex aeolicus]|uniref:Glutamate racemase n=1 Tax=Aquifex aeolicus (strain VF5) TaxID=224324 RepID=MURI_AQUAE|nr:glutamate racemase [Aquifex aeolicus]O66662.1 RecName: Full=Glutamate racemase [Aquifex aeolicus VF5]AAC06621.1 glutamate racemase [Aquifex aeolicus VF5]
MKIGIFDSGAGGMTVLKAIREAYPNVDVVYLGDTARVPYGIRSKETIVRYSKECANFLKDKGVDLLVVACNTASAYALEELKREFPFPVFGVIEPGVKEALRKSKTKRIGVIGTQATIKSGAYQEALKRAGAEVYSKACPLFVPLVEEGMIEGEIPKKVVEHYLKDFKGKVDTLILGCTHYPLLKREIQNFLEGVNVIDSSRATAKSLKDFVKNEGSGSLELYFTDRSQNLERLIKLILGEEVEPKITSEVFVL